MDNVKKISRGAVTWIVILALLATGMLGTTLYFALRKEPVRVDTMEYVYQSSFRRLTDSIDGIEEDLAIMNVAHSREAKQKVAGRVWKQSGEAAANLAALPVEHHSLEETYVLLNRIGDYLYSIAEHLAYGEDMTEIQTESVASLYTETARVREKLNALDMTMTGYIFSQHLDRNKPSVIVDAFDGSKCPSLDYDGDFSENAEKGDFGYVNGLNEIDADEAKQKASAFFERLTASGTTDGALPCYTFSTTDGAFLELTQKGGLIAAYTQENSGSGEVELQSEEASAAAIAFAERAYGVKFEEMRLFSEGNAAVVTVAPKEGNILYETETVRLKIDLTNGNVLSVNALGYLSGRGTHKNYTPALTVVEAAMKVNPALAAKCLRLSVVPCGGNKLVYVFQGSMGGNKYISYIDAFSGREIDIFRVSALDSE